MKASILILLVGFLTVACHDGCDPEDTRCMGASVQECASDGDWYEVENCGDVGPGAWECCEAATVWDGAETAGCVPIGYCDGGSNE